MLTYLYKHIIIVFIKNTVKMWAYRAFESRGENTWQVGTKQ